MKAKSRNTLRVPGWFKRRKEGVRSRITHKIYQSFAPGLISIKISNTRRIDSKIELLFNQFAIWLMREQIVTEPIWRLSHPSRVRGLKWTTAIAYCTVRLRRTLHGCVDWNFSIFGKTQRKIYMSHPSRVRGLNAYPVCHRNGLFIVVSPEDSFLLGRGWMAMDFAGSMPAKSTLCLFHLSLFTSSTV